MPLDQNSAEFSVKDDADVMAKLGGTISQYPFLRKYVPHVDRITQRLDADANRLFLTPDKPHEDADCLRAIASEYDKAGQPKTRDKLYALAFQIDTESDRVRDAFEAGWITNAGHISRDYLIGCMAADYEAFTSCGNGYFVERFGEALERGEDTEEQAGTSSFTKIGFDPDKDIRESLRDHMTGSTVVVAWPHRIFQAAEDEIARLRGEVDALKVQRDQLRSDCSRMVRKVDSLERNANPAYASGGIVQRHVGGLMGERGPEFVKPDPIMSVYGKVFGPIKAEAVKYDSIPWEDIKATKIDPGDCVIRGDDMRLPGHPIIKAATVEPEEHVTTADDIAEQIADDIAGHIEDETVETVYVPDNGPELDALYALRDNVVEEMAELDAYVAPATLQAKFINLKAKLTGVELAIEAVVEAQNPDED